RPAKSIPPEPGREQPARWNIRSVDDLAITPVMVVEKAAADVDNRRPSVDDPGPGVDHRP
ncbi:MAG: hypothetical protein OEV61_01940, partial [Chloroflexota bacterium]|nr:hypothetical protein [Chloroflexota bacterium]